MSLIVPRPLGAQKDRTTLTKTPIVCRSATEKRSYTTIQLASAEEQNALTEPGRPCHAAAAATPWQRALERCVAMIYTIRWENSP